MCYFNRACSIIITAISYAVSFPVWVWSAQPLNLILSHRHSHIQVTSIKVTRSEILSNKIKYKTTMCNICTGLNTSNYYATKTKCRLCTMLVSVHCFRSCCSSGDSEMTCLRAEIRALSLVTKTYLSVACAS